MGNYSTQHDTWLACDGEDCPVTYTAPFPVSVRIAGFREVNTLVLCSRCYEEWDNARVAKDNYDALLAEYMYPKVKAYQKELETQFQVNHPKPDEFRFDFKERKF